MTAITYEDVESPPKRLPASSSAIAPPDAGQPGSPAPLETEQERLTVALIDGDTDIAAHFLHAGYQGGITFARNFEKAAKAQGEPAPHHVMIHVFFTSSADPLKQTLLNQFLLGSNDGSKLAIAGQAQASVIKLEGFLKTFLVNDNCTTIYLGGLKTARFANALRQYPQELCKRKLLLISLDEPHPTFTLLPYKTSAILDFLPSALQSPRPNSSALGLIVPAQPGGARHDDPFSPTATMTTASSPFAPSYAAAAAQSISMAMPTSTSTAPTSGSDYVVWSPGAGWSSPSDYGPSPGSILMYRHPSIDSSYSSVFDHHHHRASSIRTAATSPTASASPASYMSPGPILKSVPAVGGPMSGTQHRSRALTLAIPVCHPSQGSPVVSTSPRTTSSPMASPPILSPMSPFSYPSPPTGMSVPLNNGQLRSPESPPSPQRHPLPSFPVPMNGNVLLDPASAQIALTALKHKIERTPKRQRPCNLYYRLGHCPHGSQCILSHRFNFSQADWAVYPLLVKQLVCRAFVNGTCQHSDDECVFGHRCRFSKEDCPFGNKCRFFLADLSSPHGEAQQAPPLVVKFKPKGTSQKQQQFQQKRERKEASKTPN